MENLKIFYAAVTCSCHCTTIGHCKGTPHKKILQNKQKEKRKINNNTNNSNVFGCPVYVDATSY